jgi:hypothetical protein
MTISNLSTCVGQKVYDRSCASGYSFWASEKLDSLR